MTDPDTEHAEIHAFTAEWIRQASQLLGDMVERLDALEHQVGNLQARVSEWEVRPR